MIDSHSQRACLALLAASTLALSACSDTGGTADTDTGSASDAAMAAGDGLAQGGETGGETAAAAADPVIPAPAAAASATFLALSDVHRLRDGHPCTGRTCQTSPAFWTATQTQAQALLSSQTPDFVIYLGDMPEHSIPDESERRPVLANVLDGLENIVSGTTTPLFYLPGNNDTVERNHGRGDFDYCPFTDHDQSVFNTVDDPTVWPVINGSADIIDRSRLTDGYYAARITVGASAAPLRILALNTNIYTADYSRCSDLVNAAATGSAQLDWLADQLDAATTANEPVLLAMHVPPGIDGHSGHSMWDDSLAYQGRDSALTGRRMQDVLLTYIGNHQPVITTVLAGHTHLNGIRRLHTCEATPGVSELLVSVPGISTDHGNTPGMKIFELGSGLEPVEVTTYGATYVEPPVDDYAWSGGISYGFRTNYPNTTPAGTSLLDQVDSLSDDARWVNMWGHLYVDDRDAAVPLDSDYEDAMDVHCAP
ncbi:metallophosphoesterase [Maricaulis maris]|uniref:3',5'-cyclic AMP phosphodiesterase CpdA n=1 Tax=Maricaulis maris TaxID=74318 RepID=A0A495DDE0_9PROT|nr:metallophosphoesterase [Maricaulis maris]RKR00357.1 3',5'-cyclic AMP phosphodiesterase CpdA [Maricaulis maris]